MSTCTNQESWPLSGASRTYVSLGVDDDGREHVLSRRNQYIYWIDHETGERLNVLNLNEKDVQTYQDTIEELIGWEHAGYWDCGLSPQERRMFRELGRLEDA